MCTLFCFFNETSATKIYTYCTTLSLHDALPISVRRGIAGRERLGFAVGGIAARFLRDRDQARDAAAALIFAAHRVAGTLGRDHEDVDVAARLDQAEMDVEAVREGERGAGLQIVGEVVIIDFRLMLVGGGDHDDVGPGGGVLVGHEDRKSTRLNSSH